MFSITRLLKGATAVSAAAIVLCLVAGSASTGAGKVTGRDARSHVAAAKVKPTPVRVVSKHYVVHPDSVAMKRGK